MKWTRLFFLLFLLPILLYASYDAKDYKKDSEKTAAEWKRHEELIQQFNALNEKEYNLHLLHESIACCERAIVHCDHILKKIEEKSKKERKDWEQAKNQAKQNKATAHIEIDNLHALIHSTVKNSTFAKAISLYQESDKKAHLAFAKNQNCTRRLHNIEEVVSTLNAVCTLYEEALALAYEALNLIASYPDDESKLILQTAIESYQASATKYRQEAADWPLFAATQKNMLKEQVLIFKAEGALFIEKGLRRSSYESHKQAIRVLEQLIENSDEEEAEVFKKELSQLQAVILGFEQDMASSRLTDVVPPLSNEEFAAREKERRELFFKGGLTITPECFLQSAISCSSAFALDGNIAKKGDLFSLYAEQFYRFLFHSDAPISELVVSVHRENEKVYEETITLPMKNTPPWERYLLIDGMTFIPETKLKSDFGLDLRLSFPCDFRYRFAMIIAQKCSRPDYKFSFSLKDKTSLYKCSFLQPPPWQLGALRKPALDLATRSPDNKAFSFSLPINNELGRQLEGSFPLLDQFVDTLKQDPLALATYVYNEIELDYRFSLQKDGIFYAPGIRKNACMTFLEKRGSPWEQCMLLVYLLRKAGYQSLYVTGTTSYLPQSFLEKMLLMKLPSGQTEGALDYPWVIFFDGAEWISLFPWMKEMYVHEGYDLYNLMPEEYASAERWILRYLKEDEKILKHIDLDDKDDTLGVLFVRFVEEELRKQGLSLSDVGSHQTHIKKQFASWSDFTRPRVKKEVLNVINILDTELPLFAKAHIDISSHENPQKKISHTFPLVELNCNAISLRFTQDRQCLHAHFIGKQAETLLDLDASDRSIDITIYPENGIETDSPHSHRTISMDKGTDAALCFHLGGSSPKVTSQFYEQFSFEKEETKRLYALLAFIGAAYFEKCGKTEKILAQLHKTPSVVDCAFGLAKLSSVQGAEELKAPQVDMIWFISQLPQEVYTSFQSLYSLITVDSSANEHQILLDVLGVKEAVSTVKLLQLAHREKRGLSEPGFLCLTASNSLKDFDLRYAQASCYRQWDFTKKTLNQGNPFDSYAYAYMTPGLTCSENRSFKEMGTLIFHPLIQGGLISSNQLLLNGGLGAPLPYDYFSPAVISKWQLVPSYNSYTLYVPPVLSLETKGSRPGTSQWCSDVRLEHKSFLSSVADPVDVVTGAFYIDEVDLTLPGPFPFEIRRNYNSQNPLIGDLGVGWKLSLNPYLIEQDDKLYAAEADGTIIAYRYNSDHSRWEVFPQDNPDLYSLTSSNPFHAYIQDDTLYGADGSKRIFKEGLLRTWINSRGNTLSFFYLEDKLTRIESVNGDFCGLLYNHEGRITEIYSRDGRRISYSYSAQGDLTKVTLPNTASIYYEYDRDHHLIRETKPYGRVLENIYEGDRVKEQRAPMGLMQSMVITATFNYQNGLTTVIDAQKGKTTYKIFQKQIYKIIDPLGYETLQTWFVDERSCFDPIKEEIVAWEGPGGAARCLQSSTDKRGLTTYYLYDHRKNPIEIGIKGQDLTGDGNVHIAKHFLYNEDNLCIQETVLDRKTTITYDIKFSYLPKRIETYSDNTCISYVDLEYNALGFIEKEDNSGSITLWKYDARGLPCTKIQLTGTDDPDVITTYAYNYQGQCIKITSDTYIQENDYDIMGNQTESKTFSLSGALLSAQYAGYDLNNQTIWKQTANPENTLYLDYHASGRIKALRQTLSLGVAYTLYEYDSRGYLIEEVNPLGYTTYRDYDALGRTISKTIDGHTACFTYEPGGLLETSISPSGAKTTYFYTTNGLIKEKIYPDGTKSSLVYDGFGRPIRETKNNITWDIAYDDSHHRVIRTHIDTKTTEIQEFDGRSNCIRFTDAAGYTSEKTYDGLGRIKIQTSPSGAHTIWNYQGDRVVCILPNGEKKSKRYEANHVVESTVVNAQEELLEQSFSHYDPEADVQEMIEGDITTTTWMNTLGLPIKVHKGNSITTYTYDACGNCISITDGDGKVTRQTFDGLKRIIQKELPDHSIIRYVYDLDSNISEYHLPNHTVWKAFYDAMKRKIVEEVQEEGQSSLHWEYTYEDGYLKEAKDPMQRLHVYCYDLSGRLVQETVGDLERHFAYDPRGLLSRAETIESTPSLVERSYDADGHLILENIYLNSILIQQSKQIWSASTRSLLINDHVRDFVYQNSQLTHVSTQTVDLAYAYNLSGSIQQKQTPFSTTTIDYNPSSLPNTIYTTLPDHTYQETLEWYPSGKLATYTSLIEQKEFTYTDRGHLQCADIGGDNRCYNAMGQVTSQGSKQYEWDPWGRLVSVTGETSTWQAVYDALGRRLQTCYNGNTTTSLYDPEHEFQEIGIQYGNKIFWKLYGPTTCDAITDEAGDAVFLIHNSLDQLIAAIAHQATLYSTQLPSPYGPQISMPLPTDILSYAQSLTWHSQSQDPTGLFWMGERYYNPQDRCFLSPDPVGYPICLDLYLYADGDPINYFDPNGRFASPVYQVVKPFVFGALQPCFNSISTHLGNHDITRSSHFQVGTFDLPQGSIGFINGINNTRAESIASAQHLSHHAEGAKIYGIYNATNWDTNWVVSTVIDVIECALGHVGLFTPPVQLLKNQWKHFIATHGPEEKFLQISHSGGALHVYNALLSSPKSVRDRIISAAFAPAAIIPKKLCFQSHNYISRRDIVTHIDIIGKLRYGNELQVLEPHPDANLWDHDFLSPTFTKTMKRHITDYIEAYGEVQ